MLPEACGKVFNACERGDSKMLREMLENGVRTFSGRVPVNSSTLRDPNDGFTALFVAAACGHAECVDILLNFDPESIKKRTYEYECTALHFAARSNSLKVVKMLCEKDISLIHCKNAKGDTPIFWACIGGNAKIVKYLISLGSVCGNSSENGVTTLMCSLMSQDQETDSDERRSKIVRQLLLKSPEMINLQDHDGTTALHLAAGFCMPKCILVLLSKGADLRIRDNNDKTALSLLMALRESPEGGDLEAKSHACVDILRKEWDRLKKESARQMLELFGIEDEEEEDEKRVGKKKNKKKGKSGSKRKKKNNKKKKKKTSKTSDGSRTVLVCDGCYDDSNSNEVNGFIDGIRWKCNVCDDFDFCETCFRKSLTREDDMTSSSHGPGHTFTKLDILSSSDVDRKEDVVDVGDLEKKEIVEEEEQEEEEQEEDEEEEEDEEDEELTTQKRVEELELPLNHTRVEKNILDEKEWITVSKQQKKKDWERQEQEKKRNEREKKIKKKKKKKKKKTTTSLPKKIVSKDETTNSNVLYAKGPDESSVGFDRKVTVSPKPSKEKYRAPMRRYGYFTSPNLFFRGNSSDGSLFRRDTSSNRFRTLQHNNNNNNNNNSNMFLLPSSSQSPFRTTSKHIDSRSLSAMMISSYPRTSQWDLALRPEHLLSRNLSELSFSQLDALEKIHADSIRRIQLARLELARANERQLVATQFQIARHRGAVNLL